MLWKIVSSDVEYAQSIFNGLKHSKLMRKHRPFIFSDVKSDFGVDDIINWIKTDVLFEGK